MHCMLARLAVGLAVGQVACSPDPRKAVVKEVVEFARAAPYDVRVERDESSEYLTIVVQDTMLPRYTALVERLADDSAGAQRALYSNLAYFLFAYASIIDADAPVFAGGDTLEARVLFRRPDSTLFSRQVTGWMSEQRRYIGALAATMEDHRMPLEEPTLRREWAARYARARQELREPDTLILRITRNGTLVDLTTAGRKREAEVYATQEARRRAHTTRLLPAIAFRRLTRTLDDDLVSVEGRVSSDTVGWWPADEVKSHSSPTRWNAAWRGARTRSWASRASPSMIGRSQTGSCACGLEQTPGGFTM